MSLLSTLSSLREKPKSRIKEPAEFRDWAFAPEMGKVASPCYEKNKQLPDSALELLEEAHKGIIAEQNSVQKKLARYEINNPSLQRYEGIQDRAVMVKELEELVKYKAVVVNDRVGTDFATNQPKYKAREIIVG